MFDGQPAALPYSDAQAPARASYGALLAQTMLLVGLAIGVLTMGAWISRDYAAGTATAFTIGGIAMLFAQSFAAPLRHGLVGTTWLLLIALALGIGLGPTLKMYVEVSPDVVAEAAGMTAVIVLGAASVGTLMSQDLARWMRPLSLIVFGTVAVSWIMMFAGQGGNPIISGAIGILSGLLIVVDFNYLRRHATDDDVVFLATGIFVSVINIFLTLLNLLRP